MESSKTTTPESQIESSASNHSNNPWRWVVPLLLLVGGFLLGKVSPPMASQPPAKEQSKALKPRPVTITTLSTGTATRKVSLLGQVEATQQSTLRSQSSGVVQEILVQPGDRVKTGMVVAILDDSDQKLSIAQAQAQLAQQKSNLARLDAGTRPEIIAQRQAAVASALARERVAHDNLKRIKELVKEGALSQRTLVEAQSSLDEYQGERLEAQAELAEAKAGPIREEIAAQRANVSLAQANLAQAELAQQRTRIVSSQTGVVRTRTVSQGDLVEISSPILTLVASDRFDIFLELPEELTGQVTPGMSVELTSRVLPEWKKVQPITAVVPSADSTSRRQRVRVQIEDPPPGLLSGMAIAANLSIPSNRSSFVVSRDALTRREDQWLVFKVADSKAEQVEVEMIADMGQKVAIYHPSLETGQQIVLRGGDGLQDGASVKIVN